MKKNVQHDFILTQILQEIRELRKDVEYIKSHYEVSILEDYVINTSPIDFTQSDWYKELVSISKDTDEIFSISEDIDEKIIKLTEETQKVIDDYEKEEKIVFFDKPIELSKINKNIISFIKNLRW